MRSQAAILVVCSAFALFPLQAVAEQRDSGDALNEISLNVFEAAYWAANGAIPFFVGYQRVLADHLTLSVLPVLGYWPNNPVPYVEYQQWLELDWHPVDHGLKGFFVGMALVGVVLNRAADGSRGTSWFLGVAPACGYQFLLPRGIDLDFAVGLTVGAAFAEEPGGGRSIRFLSDHRRAEIGIGYRF